MKTTRSRYLRPRRSNRGGLDANSSRLAGRSSLFCGPRPIFQPLEPRKLLSATAAQIGEALDLDPSIMVTYTGNSDAVGVYENYEVEGILGMPSGPDGDYLVLSTARAFDAVRTTDEFSRDITLRDRDLGVSGAADDFATVSFTLAVPAATYNQRLLIDFLYASDRDTDGGDFFDITVNGTNIAATNGSRIEAGGQYVTNERDPDLAEDAPGPAIQIGTEYSDLLNASYTIPDGTTSLDITISIADSNDAEKDAWALIDNIRFEQTQVVFLDFDGEDIGGFFVQGTDYIVPSFDSNDFGLGSDFADVIKGDLESIFSDFDIVFTTSLPSSGNFMHVVIGGENRDTLAVADAEENQWLIREVDTDPTFKKVFNYVNFRNSSGDEVSYGLADRLDLGNENQSDMAVVFAKQIARDGLVYSHLRNSIAHYIGRNLGLRAESNAFTNSIMAEGITFRGDMIEDAAHAYDGSDWGDLDALGITQNAHEVLLDNLGAAAGDTDLRNSWVDARKLNQAHWTIAQPIKNPLFEGNFTIIGDKHTRTVTTVAPTWSSDQILITDFAGEDPSIVITATSKQGQEHDFETIGPRNLGQFTAVQDDAKFTLIGLWEVVGSGAFFQGSATLIQTEAADTTVYFRDFEFVDDDGDKVKFTLNTGNGLFAVSETDKGIVITLAETLSVHDNLKINVNKVKGGDGRATIGGIQGSGLKTLTADKIDFSGTGIDLVSLQKGKFGSFIDGTDFNVRQDENTRGDFTFEVITGDSHLVMGRETKKFSADDIEAGAIVFDELQKFDSKADIAVAHMSVRDGQKAKITAKADIVGGSWEFWRETKDSGKEIKDSFSKLESKGSILGNLTIEAFANAKQIKTKGDLSADITAGAMDKLDVKGNWTGSVNLTDDGTVFKQASKRIKVKGIVQNVLFQAVDDVNKFLLGAVTGSNFYIGFDSSVTSGLPVDISLMTNSEARVKQLKMKGVSGVDDEYVNSVFSTGRFDNIDLRDVNGDNLGVPFGVSAIRIDKIKFNTGTGNITQKKDDAFNDNDAGDDFFIGHIV